MAFTLNFYCAVHIKGPSGNSVAFLFSTTSERIVTLTFLLVLFPKNSLSTSFSLL